MPEAADTPGAFAPTPAPAATPTAMSVTPDGAVLLRVHVVPGARRSEAVGWHGGALKVRLAAPPVDGRANAELLAWLARELGCAKQQLALRRGQASRAKEVRLALPAAQVGGWLARVV